MTPLLGPTTITLAQAEAWARANNAHQRFIAVLPLYVEHGPRYGVPAENAIAQAAHETAFGHYTGQVPPEYHNWCGLKIKRATGDKPEDHMRFPSDSMGVIAHLQHICAYAGKDAAELPDVLVDPRYELVTKHTTTVEGLGGAWAPSPTYGQMVAAHIARLKATVAPMAAQIPGFEWVPETCGEYGYPQGAEGRNGVVVDRLIMHCTIGTNSLKHLTGCNKNSIHFLDWRDGTPRAQMLLLSIAAWGAGNREYNLRGVHYEHECTGAEMLNPAYWTDSIINNMARNCANILRHPECAGIKPDREHVIGHVEVPDQDHTDPGPVFPWDRFMAALQRELAPAPPSQSDSYLSPKTGQYVVNIHIIQPDGSDRWVNMLDQCDVRRDAGQPVGEPIAGMVRRTDGAYSQLFESGLLVLYGSGASELIPFDNLYADEAA